MASETVGAVVVAAGSGTRFGGDKVFAPLGGRPVLAYSLDVFEDAAAVTAVVLVLSEANLEAGRALLSANRWHKVAGSCIGGGRRQDSVREGLLRLPEMDLVMIHDGARPLVTLEMIEAGLAAARSRGAAVAAVPVRDTIKIVGPDGIVEGTPDRRKLWAVQTPQVFRRDLMLAAYQQSDDDATDDAMLLERAGIPVLVFPGAYDNIKITTPDDLALAEWYLARRTKRREG